MFVDCWLMSALSLIVIRYVTVERPHAPPPQQPSDTMQSFVGEGFTTVSAIAAYRLQWFRK